MTSRNARARPLAGGWMVGVDIGGTWVRAVALDEQGRRRRAKIPRGPASGALSGVVRRAIEALGLGRGGTGALCVAARGVWTRAERRRVQRALAPLAPVVRVMSDVEAAYLGALGTAAGILLLAGTGSIALGRDPAGRWHRAGGLGPLLGDEGSAFWIGRAWLRATDRRGDPPRLRRLATAPDAVARIAATAPAALRAARCGNRAARAIVRDAQRGLAGTVVAVARRLRLAHPAPVSWAGSLLSDRGFRAGVWRSVRRTGALIEPRPPAASPAEAAARAAGDRSERAGEGRRPRGRLSAPPRPGDHRERPGV